MTLLAMLNWTEFWTWLDSVKNLTSSYEVNTTKIYNICYVRIFVTEVIERLSSNSLRMTTTFTAAAATIATNWMADQKLTRSKLNSTTLRSRDSIAENNFCIWIDLCRLSRILSILSYKIRQLQYEYEIKNFDISIAKWNIFKTDTISATK